MYMWLCTADAAGTRSTLAVGIAIVTVFAEQNTLDAPSTRIVLRTLWAAIHRLLVYTIWVTH